MKTQQVLNILKVASWVIFFGLCIKPGAMLISTFVSLFINPLGARDLYLGLDLHEIYEFNKFHYAVLIGLMVTIELTKAYLFFWVVKTISKLNATLPFSLDMYNMISKMSKISLQIAITAIITSIYSQYLYYKMLHFKPIDTETEYLYLAGILYVIALIFKKGIELQSENELTI